MKNEGLLSVLHECEHLLKNIRCKVKDKYALQRIRFIKERVEAVLLENNPTWTGYVDSMTTGSIASFADGY
jgi:hypothetical protein